MQVNFIPDIKSTDEVYDVGCLCEVRIKEQKEMGVSVSSYFTYILLVFYLYFNSNY